MAGPLDLRGRVTILDAGATQTLKRIGGAMSAISQKARAATTYVNNVGDSANRGGRRFSSRMGGITGTGMGTFAAAAGGAAFIRNEYDYQSAMNRTQAVLNITDDQMYKLNGRMVDGSTYFKQHSDLVVDLAKRYPATSAEIAKGASELAMAGMSMEQLNEVLESTIQGSMASGESIKTVGMGVTDVLLGLGKALTKSNYQELNNVMAAASTSFSQDYSQFLAGYAKTAPMARMLNMDMRQLAGTLGILADAGFKAEKGGTALRSSIVYAAAPSKKAQAQLAKYGVQLSDFKKKTDTFQLGGAAGAKALTDLIADELGVNTDGLDKILEPILSDPKTLGNTTKMRRDLVKNITSAMGIDDPQNAEKIASSVNAFIESGFQQLDFIGLLRKLEEVGFDKDLVAMDALFKKRFIAPMGALINSLEPGGAFDQKMELFLPRVENAVKRFADILMKGLPGALKRLGGAFDGLLRAMASSGAIDTVVGALEKMRDGLNWLSEFSPTTLKAFTLALLGLAVLAPVGMALSAVGAGIGVIASALAGVGALALVVTKFARSLLLLGAGAKAAGRIAGLFGGIGGGTAAGGVAAGAAGGGLLARMMGKVGIKGLGKLASRAFFPAMLAWMAYDGYQGYQKNGWTGALLNALTLGLYDGSGDEGAKETDVEIGQPRIEGMGGPAGQNTASQLAALESQAQQSAAGIRSAMNLDLTAEGMRAGQTFAAGLAQGMQSAVSAAQNAASQIRAAAGGGVPLNTGPSMRGAN